jgi:hypothetical protein
MKFPKMGWPKKSLDLVQRFVLPTPGLDVSCSLVSHLLPLAFYGCGIGYNIEGKGITKKQT